MKFLYVHQCTVLLDNPVNEAQTSIPDFDVLRSMSSDSHCEVLVARSHGDGKLYVVKTLRRNIVSEPSLHNQIRAEQACLRAVSENNGPFLPTLHRSFYDDERLYLITVSVNLLVEFLSDS